MIAQIDPRDHSAFNVEHSARKLSDHLLALSRVKQFRVAPALGINL